MAVISLVETTWFLRQKDSVPSDAAITENAPADDEIPQNQPLEKAPDEPLEQFAETYFFTDREKEIFGMPPADAKPSARFRTLQRTCRRPDLRLAACGNQGL